MTVRYDVTTNWKLLGTAKASISTATTTAFDFGTPNDLNLAALDGYAPGDRVVVVFTATTSGSTNNVSFGVQDAPDSNGSIGTPAAAATSGTLTGGTGDEFAFCSVKVQPGRPWLRCNVTSNGTTDTFAATATVFAVPRVAG